MTNSFFKKTTSLSMKYLKKVSISKYYVNINCNLQYLLSKDTQLIQIYLDDGKDYQNKIFQTNHQIEGKELNNFEIVDIKTQKSPDLKQLRKNNSQHQRESNYKNNPEISFNVSIYFKLFSFFKFYLVWFFIKKTFLFKNNKKERIKLLLY